MVVRKIPSMPSTSSCFALVPAAGNGSRMGFAHAKQYLALAGLPLIAHSLRALCAVSEIQAVFVILSAADGEWKNYDWTAAVGKHSDKLVPLYCGGQTRAESVANGLRAAADRVREQDWVLVHDAARPCLTVSQIDVLLHEVGDDPVGGILAVQVADTLKRGDENRRIEATISREQLWQAQTPQMFRHGMLLKALAQNDDVTDEASAIEALGHRPKLVASDASNLKVTWPQDLLLAESILKARHST